MPEPWAGNLLTARIVFISSNPSISRHEEGLEFEEDYPRASWPDDRIADFVTNRFAGHWATPEGRYLQRNGEYSRRTVAFWVAMSKRAGELLDRPADPAADYVMTEVVHCKSRDEVGVAKAVARCSDLHLQRILAATRGPLIVIIGAHAKERLRDRWRLPAGFGQEPEARSGEADSVLLRRVGDQARVVTFLPHPNSFSRFKRFDNRYPANWQWLRDVADGRITPEDLASAN